MRWMRSLACALALSWAGVAFAQDGSQDNAAESRATSFQAVEGPTKENVAGGPLLVSAYAFVLVVLLAYVARLGLLQRRTSADVDRLGELLSGKRVGAGGAAREQDVDPRGSAREQNKA